MPSVDGNTIRKLRTLEKGLAHDVVRLREIIGELDGIAVPPDSLHILQWWNTLAEEVGLPRIRRLSEKRWIAAKNRLKEPEFEDLDELAEAIKEQPFLAGVNDRGWRLTFDAIFERRDMALKILERGYKAVSEPARSELPLYGGGSAD